MITPAGLDYIAKCKTCGASAYMDFFEHYKKTSHEDYELKVVRTPWK